MDKEAEKALAIQDQRERDEAMRQQREATNKYKQERLREFEAKRKEEHDQFLAQQKREEERRLEVLERVAAQDGLFRQHMHEKLSKKVTHSHRTILRVCCWC